ncbi:MAG: NAD-dependent epimerase/dehydratase family protein, partial [Gemmatimonadales bacterium]
PGTMAETVFVTGGTGMVGANLARRLIEDGHHVRLLVRARVHPFLDHLPYQPVSGDLADLPALIAGMAGCSQVYHVAGAVSYRARDTRRLFETNVQGTRNLLAAAARAGVKRVVHTSSTAAVGMSERPHQVLDEATPFDRRFESDPYMWTKHLAEREVARAAEEGLDAVIVNPSTIYGSGDVYRNTTAIFRSLKRGRVFAAPPGGNSVVSVDDVVRGLLLAMERGQTGRRYILSAERFTYRDMLDRMAGLIGGTPPRWTLPSALEWPLAAAAGIASTLFPSLPLSPSVIRFSFRYRYFSSAHANTELGWVPKTSFDEAVRAAWRFAPAG